MVIVLFSLLVEKRMQFDLVLGRVGSLTLEEGQKFSQREKIVNILLHYGAVHENSSDC